MQTEEQKLTQAGHNWNEASAIVVFVEVDVPEQNNY
jgi:hypothetical protein